MFGIKKSNKKNKTHGIVVCSFQDGQNKEQEEKVILQYKTMVELLDDGYKILRVDVINNHIIYFLCKE